MSSSKDRFEFDTEFQQSILQYTVTDKDGYKALESYNPDFFTQLEHGIIATALKLYYKQKYKLPKSRVVFQEFLRKLYQGREFKDLLDSDRKSINKILTQIYSGPVQDGQEILQEIYKFNSYSKLKETLENLNLEDFSAYENFSKKVREAINIANVDIAEKPLVLLGEARKRVSLRKHQQVVYPTPFWQLNKYVNAGGYNRGSVVVFLGPEKHFKTLVLVNLAKNYLKRKKKILYIDLENGQDGIAIRVEQSILNKSKHEVLSGEYDTQLLKNLRKYRRFGGELIIKRMPAYITTTQDIQVLIDELARDSGIKFDVLIIDYAVLMGSCSNKKDDTERISDAYIDLKNLTQKNNYELCITAHHITREGKRNISTRYQPNDVAKCIDISRHIDALWGINQSEDERENRVVRLELVLQRDGEQQGSAYFWINPKNQRLVEFNHSQLGLLHSEYKEKMNSEIVKKKEGIKNSDV